MPGARWVPLTQGRFALVDEEDYARVSLFNWIFAPHGYAYRMRPRVAKTPEEAALAYNVAAVEAFGEYAKLNDLTQREGVEGGEP